MTESPLYLGIDVGTSGCRACVIDSSEAVLAEVKEPLTDNDATEQNPDHWWQALDRLMVRLAERFDTSAISAMGLDGTSGTLLLIGPDGVPRSPALMYNDNRATAQATLISRFAQADSAAHGTSSALAKWLWLREHYGEGTPRSQADWLLGQLTGRHQYSDCNNALKLGYDAAQCDWPAWLDALHLKRQQLPEVVSPGTAIGHVRPELARRWSLSPDLTVCAGTTDSTAAIWATDIRHSGEAVTSLGSTIVTKILAPTPIFAPEFGVYSQPYGDLWLVGGGSNSGGTVLRRFFSDNELATLSLDIDPETSSGLDYYPLPQRGERFPIHDPNLEPKLSPRPDSDALFLHGLLEGMARIESLAYQRLNELGAPPLTRILSVGGGAANPVWQRIRERLLGVPVILARQTQAAFGCARLVKRAREKKPG